MEGTLIGRIVVVAGKILEGMDPDVVAGWGLELIRMGIGRNGNVLDFVVGWGLEWIRMQLLEVGPTLLKDDLDAVAGSGTDVAGDWKGIRTQLQA